MKPLVLVAILAKQKQEILPAWLKSLENWDYPKDRIAIYIRSNDNTDQTEDILRQWVKDNEYKYFSVWQDYESVDSRVSGYEVHEWNQTRFEVLGKIRQLSVDYAYAEGADFYFVCDVDNFLLPDTLSRLVEYNLPVVAPLLYDAGKTAYSNYHNIATPSGYYFDNQEYYTILNGKVRGLVLCDVVHCTYLIRRDVMPLVRYQDSTDDYEYVIFSRNLRKYDVPQYLDNSRVHGYLSMNEDVQAVLAGMKGLTNETR